MVLFIYIEQLDILGFTKQYRLLAMLVFILFLSFYFVTPLIKWLVDRKFSLMISFLVLSLFMLNVFFVLSVVTNDLNIVQLGLQSLVGFGSLTGIYLLIKVLVLTLRRLLASK